IGQAQVIGPCPVAVLGDNGAVQVQAAIGRIDVDAATAVGNAAGGGVKGNGAVADGGVAGVQEDAAAAGRAAGGLVARNSAVDDLRGNAVKIDAPPVGGRLVVDDGTVLEDQVVVLEGDAAAGSARHVAGNRAVPNGQRSISVVDAAAIIGGRVVGDGAV